MVVLGKLSGEDFIESCKRLVGRPVLHLAASHINDEELREQLHSMYDKSGFLQCEFNEIDFKLNITLSIVPKNYKTKIDIPHEDYIKDVVDKYKFITNIAATFWETFCMENNEICTKLRQLSDVNFDKLHLTDDFTLYFDENHEQRIGIFCYYVDKNNQPFIKRNLIC